MDNNFKREEKIWQLWKTLNRLSSELSSKGYSPEQQQQLRVSIERLFYDLAREKRKAGMLDFLRYCLDVSRQGQSNQDPLTLTTLAVVRFLGENSSLGTSDERLKALVEFQQGIDELREKMEQRSQLYDAIADLFTLILKAVSYSKLRLMVHGNTSVFLCQPYLWQVLRNCSVEADWGNFSKDTVFSAEPKMNSKDLKEALRFYLNTDDANFQPKYLAALGKAEALSQRIHPYDGSDSVQCLVGWFTHSYKVFCEDAEYLSRKDPRNTGSRAFRKAVSGFFGEKELVVRQLAKFCKRNSESSLKRMPGVPPGRRSQHRSVRWADNRLNLHEKHRVVLKVQ